MLIIQILIERAKYNKKLLYLLNLTKYYKSCKIRSKSIYTVNNSEHIYTESTI